MGLTKFDEFVLIRNIVHSVVPNGSTCESYPVTRDVIGFSNYVLEMSDGMENMGAVNWKLALCLLLAWIIIFVCLIKGIQSLGKVRCPTMS